MNSCISSRTGQAQIKVWLKLMVEKDSGGKVGEREREREGERERERKRERKKERLIVLPVTCLGLLSLLLTTWQSPVTLMNHPHSINTAFLFPFPLLF